MRRHISHRQGKPPTPSLVSERPGEGSRSSGAFSLPPALMTVEELAVILRTSKGAIYARYARGGIPGGLRLGRTIRFDPRIIAKWLTANGGIASPRDDQ